MIAQERVVEALRRALASNRVAHAYLFHGPEGSGKRAAALALAQALECPRRAEGEAEACGACVACQKVERLIHPDVHVYLPLPSDAAEEDAAPRLERLAENPYAAVDFRRRPSLDDPAKTSNKRPFYSVDRVREITRSLRFAPAEGRHKVAVMTDVDTMNEAAANAFLKALEEPTPRTVLVLTTEHLDSLLPTIVSRCQRLRFDPLPAEALEAALAEREGLEPERAALLARMADGSYARALALAESDDLARSRAFVLEFLRAAFSGRTDRLAELVEEMTKGGREPVKALLELMMRWVRDLLLSRALGPEAPLVNIDQQEAVRSFVANLPEARLDAMAALLEQAGTLVERNVSVQLVLTVLADALREAMRGRPRTRLYTPLDELRVASYE